MFTKTVALSLLKTYQSINKKECIFRRFQFKISENSRSSVCKRPQLDYLKTCFNALKKTSINFDSFCPNINVNN
jgi:hypothetical protein